MHPLQEMWILLLLYHWQLGDQPQHANGGLQHDGDLQPTEIPVPENIRPTPPPEEIPNNEVRGRKRRQMEKNQRKRLKNQGKSYTSSKFSSNFPLNFPSVMFGPENCKCSRKCHEKVSSPDVLSAVFILFGIWLTIQSKMLFWEVQLKSLSAS